MRLDLAAAYPGGLSQVAQLLSASFSPVRWALPIPLLFLLFLSCPDFSFLETRSYYRALAGLEFVAQASLELTAALLFQLPKCLDDRYVPIVPTCKRGFVTKVPFSTSMISEGKHGLGMW